jgi:hypothetical protein
MALAAQQLLITPQVTHRAELVMAAVVVAGRLLHQIRTVVRAQRALLLLRNLYNGDY